MSIYTIRSKSLFVWFLKGKSHSINYWHPKKSKLLFINLAPTKFLMAQFYFPDLRVLTTTIKSIICKIYLVFIISLMKVTAHFILFFFLTNNILQFSLLLFQEAKNPKVFYAVQKVVRSRLYRHRMYFASTLANNYHLQK